MALRFASGAANAGSTPAASNETHAPLNFFDDHFPSVANEVHSGSRSGSSSAINLNLASISVARFKFAFAQLLLPILRKKSM